MLDKRTLRTLYAVLVLCLALRIGLSIYYMDADVPHEGLANVRIGQCLADGNGFSIDPSYGEGDPIGKLHLTAYRGPIYPAFLGIIFATFGEDVAGVPIWSIVQSVFDTLTCFLIFLFSMRMLGRPKAALVASVLYAVYLPMAIGVTVPMPETLAALFTLLACYALMRALGGESSQYKLAGAMMGLVILVKPMMIGFPFAVVLMLMLRRRRLPGWTWRAAVYVIMAYLVVSPWTYRNYRVFHTFIPVSTGLGNTLWTATGPADGKTPAAWNSAVASRTRKKPTDRAVIVVSESTYQQIRDLQDSLHDMSEVQMDRTLRSEAAAQFTQHKGRYALLVVKRLFRLWLDLWTDVRFSAESCLLALLNAAILVLAFFGYRQTKVDYRVKLTGFYLVAYVTIVSVLTSGVIRDSYPIMPMVIILAAAYLGRIFDGGSSRSRLVIKVK